MKNTEQDKPRGGVRQRPWGTWQARIVIPGKGRTCLGSYATEAEARGILLAALQQLEGTKHEPGTTRSFDAFGLEWINRRLAAGVVRAHNELLNWQRYVSGTPLGNQAITSIRRRDVKAWLLALGNKHPIRWYKGKRVEDKTKRLSDETQAGLVRLLTQAFTQAVEDEIIRSNPATGTKARKHGVTSQSWNYLTPAEQDSLLKTVPAPYCHMVAFALGTGLRLSELWALRLVDIHMDTHQPFVEVCFGGKHKPTKSKKPRRVPLFGIALDGIKAWLPTLEDKPNPLGLVFPSTVGYYRDRKPPSAWFKWRREAGLSQRVRWYDLRHTCASSLVAGWWGRRWTMPEVKAMLGHSSVTVTERYAHLAEDVLLNAGAEMPGSPFAHSTWGTLGGRESSDQSEIEGDFQSGKPGSNRRHQPWQGSGESMRDKDIGVNVPHASPEVLIKALKSLRDCDEDLVEQLHAIATSALQDRTVVLAQRVLSKNDATVYVAGYELICELLERCEMPAKKRRAS